MQRTTTLVVSVLALSALLGGTAVATGNQPPLADAGLDQSVERGATVQLDANGSRDPDGTIEGVEWSIETPDGTTRTPDCPICVQTTFSPAETGQYNVTVIVTDDDGASRSDTLHVDVVAAGGPSVSVSAPPALPTGSRRNLTANATAGDADLRTLAWVVNGTARNQTQLAGENGTSTITHTFTHSGSVSVRAVAYDAAGRRGVSNQTVRVVDSSNNGGGGGSRDGCPGGSGNYYVDGQNQGCTSAAMTVEDTVIDTDGRDGLWVYMDGDLTQIIEEANMNRYSEDGYGGTFSKETVDERKEDIKQQEENQDDFIDVDDGGSSNDDGSSDESGSTRPASSVPNNLINPDSGDGGDDDDGGYDWSYHDDDGSSSDDDDSNGNDDGSSSSDNDDQGGFLDGIIGGGDDDDDDSGGDDDGDSGSWFGGGSDDDNNDGDDDSGGDGGGGWSFW
ncbi:PKD domain-containing protein [Haloarcula amylolytica]|uniref:PKD domain-containing protein n=1 Tax=Haloarcula amylolytica TaxID=396317 RepID=UPI003C74482D